MSRLLDQNRSYESREASIQAGLHLMVNQMLPLVTNRVKSVLATENAGALKLALVEYPTNSVDSEFSVNASVQASTGVVEFSLPVKVVGGKPQVSEGVILEAYLKAKAEFEKAPAVLSTVAAESMDVDLSQVKAERHGDLVIYSSPALPNWSYMAPTTSLLAENHRGLIASRILSSIRGFCLSDFRLVAKFKQTEFSLPMVREVNVQASAVPAEHIPGFSAPQGEQEITAEIYMRNLQVHGAMASQAPAFFNDGDSQRLDFESKVRKVVTAEVATFVKNSLKGSRPTILAFDYSKLQDRPDGRMVGVVGAEVQFYGNMSIDTTTLNVHFDASGKVVSKETCKSPLAIKAEAEKERELKILSDEEAARQMDAYRKKQASDTQTALEAGMGGIQAAIAPGSNLFSRPAAERIPVLKALMPTDVKIGDKIEVRGYVYQVAETDFNAPDVLHSAYVMLCLLKDEMPSAKIASIGSWG